MVELFFKILLVISVGGIVSGTALPYDCRLHGCSTNGQCSSDGSCTCTITAPNVNYRCELYAPADGSDYVCSSCTDNTIGGTAAPNCIHQDYATQQCACQLGYTGADCADERINVDCTPNGAQITVSITPYKREESGTFGGIIYLGASEDFSDHEGIPASCKTTSPEQTIVKIINTGENAGLPGGAECDMNVPLDEGGTSYTMYAYIQHNQHYMSDADQVIKVTCPLTTDVTDGVVQFLPNNPTPGNNLLERTIAQAPNGLTMALKLDNGDTIAQPIPVGEDIILLFQLDADFTVKECIARNAETGATAEVQLIENWCVTPGAMSLFRGALLYGVDSTIPSVGGTGTSGKAIRMQLKAWYFLTSAATSALYITCTACIECAPDPIPECSNTYSSFTLQDDAASPDRRRRRRSSPTEAAIDTTLSVSVDVTDGVSSIRGGNQRDTSTVDSTEDLIGCYQSISVLLPVILLAVLLVFAIIIAVYFFSRANQTLREQDKKSHNMRTISSIAAST